MTPQLPYSMRTMRPPKPDAAGKPIDRLVARQVQQKLAQSGRAVRVVAMRGTEPVETQIVELRKSRGLFLWYGVELDTGHELEIVSVRF